MAGISGGAVSLRLLGVKKLPVNRKFLAILPRDYVETGMVPRTINPDFSQGRSRDPVRNPATTGCIFSLAGITRLFDAAWWG